MSNLFIKPIRIILNTTNYKPNNKVIFKKGCINTVPIEVVINDRGGVLAIPEGTTGSIKMMKPDNKEILNPVKSIINNVVTFEMDEDMQEAAGLAECELILMDGENVYTSVTFPMEIHGSVYSDKNIQSTSEYKTILNALVAVNAAGYVAQAAYSVASEAETILIDVNAILAQAETDYNQFMINSGNAIDTANVAAENANTKASLANQKAVLADEKASIADQKAILADQKATYADQMGIAAQAATTNAENKIADVEARFNTLTSAQQQESEVIDARKGQISLKAKMDLVDSELAQIANEKANVSYVDAKTQANNLSFKESYLTFAALQAAYPTGDTFNHAIIPEGATVGNIYSWVNGAWIDTRVQANGTGIADSSVKINSLDFSKTNALNLFDGNYSIGLGVNTSDLKVSAVSTGTYVVIPLVQGEQYHIKKFDSSNRFRVATFSGLPEVNDVALRLLTNLDLDTEVLFTPNDDEKYMFIYISSIGEKPRLNICKSKTDNWIPYKVISKNYIENIDVTIDTLTFSKSNPLNLFNGNYSYGYAVNTGDFKMVSYTSSSYVILQLEYGKQYHIKKFDSSNRFRVATFSGLPEVNDVALRLLTNLDLDTEVLFTPNVDEKYMFIHISSIGEKPRLNIANVQTDEWIPYKIINNTYVEKTDSSYLVMSENNTNLFDGKYLYGFALYDYANGTPFEFRMTPNRVCAIIPINAEEKIFVRRFDTSNYFRVATFAQYPEVGAKAVRSITNQINIAGELNCKTTIQTGEQYLVIFISTIGEMPRINVTKSFDACDFINYKVVNKEDIQVSDAFVDRKYLLFGKFDEYYQTDECEDVSAGKTFDLKQSTISDIYQLYDALMSDHSLIMTKNLLGYGGDVNGNADTNLPIYEYVISTSSTTQNEWKGMNTSLYDSPVFLLQAGTHGDEKSTVWSMYQFIKQMLTNWETNEILASIKSNISFKILPILNPAGYNVHSRRNARNVNINRNFSYNWNAEIGTDKGAAPLSEIETRVLCDWLNKNKNAFAYIDYHNFTRQYDSRNAEITSYCITKNGYLHKLYSSVIRRLSDKWKNKYFSNYSNLGNVAYGYLSNEVFPCTVNEAYDVYGIKRSSTIEITLSDPITISKMYTKPVIETGVEMLANYILAILDNYKN